MTQDRAEYEIGYTEYRTDLPGGQFAAFTSMRAYVVRADGTGRRALAEGLTQEPYAWTAFAGWSPDGRFAILNRGWESPENAAWEREHQTFRMTEGWLHDAYLFDMETGALANVTAVERVSIYNTGLFFWPDDPDTLGFEALIDGISHPFRMDRNGRNKRDLTSGKEGFTYGFNASPDGARIAYHKEYQVFLADADGGNPCHVETGCPFNFAPRWSPDGAWLLFLAGEHYDCHPHVARRDGTGLCRVGDRQGYRGVMESLDTPDFHSAHSDVPVWSTVDDSIYYTAQFDDRVEVMRTSPSGKVTRLMRNEPGVHNYHPAPSPDGSLLSFGSNRTGTRQLYVMAADGSDWQRTVRLRPYTDVPPGHGAKLAHWRPVAGRYRQSP